LSSRRCSTWEKSRRRSSAVPSEEALSTTVTSTCGVSALRQSGSRCAPFHVNTSACATWLGRVLDVGINAAPLAAQRTGVGRYIAGLLDALEALRPQGLRARPLFLPGPAQRGLRGLVKRLPFAYALAEASRAVSLERERQRGLSVYHETNHAAPMF